MKDYAFAEQAADLYHQNNQPAEARKWLMTINMLSAAHRRIATRRWDLRRLELAYAYRQKGADNATQTRQVDTTGDRQHHSDETMAWVLRTARSATVGASPHQFQEPRAAVEAGLIASRTVGHQRGLSSSRGLAINPTSRSTPPTKA
jgi:hypothetical protein